MKPGVLYRYENISLQTLANLRNRVIYFGPPRDFNDKYDCSICPQIGPISDDDVEAMRRFSLTSPRHVGVSKEQLRTMPTPVLRLALHRAATMALEGFSVQFNDLQGVACFSENHDNLLMWGHYGGRFSGMCLEFSTDNELFNMACEVQYADEYPVIDALAMLRGEPDPLIIEKLFRTKSSDWSYEREWRIIHKESRKQYHYPDGALSGIYFGPEVEDQTIDIVCLMTARRALPLRLWRGRRSTTRFRVEFDEIRWNAPSSPPPA